MKRQAVTFIIIFLILTAYLCLQEERGFSAGDGPHSSYVEQLKELNYLVMKTSAVNIIYGLNLTREQAVKLRKLSLSIDATNPPLPDMNGDAIPELVRVKKVFRELFSRLLYRKKLSESFKKKVTRIRIMETGIIRKSISGSRSTGYRGRGCLRCHAPSSFFPRKKTPEINPGNVSPGERERIDRAHLMGFFGQRGAYELWNMKSRVSKILTNAQKYMMNTVNCSLIPPDHLANPTRVGQAILSGDWYKYFKEIRNIKEGKWKTYRKLYFHIPFGDFIRAISPGISKEKKRDAIKRMGAVIEHVRGLDDIDYQLKKEKLVSDLTTELDRIQGGLSKNRTETDLNQYRVAMFLLFPKNRVIYDEVIKRIDADH